MVHAKGTGAHSYFEAAAGASQYSKAKVFSQAGKRTPVFARFSTVGGERGSADTARDPRGFAIKHYTEEGIWSATRTARRRRTARSGLRGDRSAAAPPSSPPLTHGRLCSATVLRVIALIAGTWVRLTNRSTGDAELTAAGLSMAAVKRSLTFFVFAAAPCVFNQSASELTETASIGSASARWAALAQ